jgi:hypothetical protein
MKRRGAFPRTANEIAALELKDLNKSLRHWNGEYLMPD